MDIAYTADWVEGPISFIGSVVTDGTIGPINPCTDFLDGGGFVTDATHDFTSTVPNSAVCSQTGPSAWTATATSITFDLNAAQSETTFASPNGVFSLSFISDGEISVVDSNGDTVSAPAFGELTFATATAIATPEPSTSALLLVGLIGLLGLMVMTPRTKEERLPEGRITD
jgi:hypothetical protein